MEMARVLDEAVDTASGPCRRRTTTPALGVARACAAAHEMRTFRCTVGAYGLRGCSTSDTPSASHARPASCGRCAVADGGSALPVTCEKQHAARARARRRPRATSTMPPPPSGRRHSSRRNGAPRRASSAAHDARLQADAVRRGRRRCPALRRRRVAVMAPSCAARARDGRCRCGTACRRNGSPRPRRTRRAAPGAANRRARSRRARDRRSPSTRAAVDARAGMEHRDVGMRLRASRGRALDDVAAARRVRDSRRAASTTVSAARRSHSASTRSSVPSSACSTSTTRSERSRTMIGCVSGSPSRQLNSSTRGAPAASIITPA